MGLKKNATLLDGVTSTGASSELDIRQYQKTIYFHAKTSGTPNFVLAIQIQDPDGDWESIHSETITHATKFIQLDYQPFHKYRANVTTYTSGTIDVFAYWI